MKIFLAVMVFAATLMAGSVSADDLMNAYQAEYNKLTNRLARAKVTASKDCGNPPTMFCIGSMSLVGQYKNNLDELKLRVLEQYEKLPEWWRE